MMSFFWAEQNGLPDIEHVWPEREKILTKMEHAPIRATLFYSNSGTWIASFLYTRFDFQVLAEWAQLNVRE